MKGKELIEKLDSMSGNVYTFAVGDVIFSGFLSINDFGSYKIGNVLFAIYPTKNYTFNYVENSFCKTIYIEEVF